jgi:hypothetical protein
MSLVRTRTMYSRVGDCGCARDAYQEKQHMIPRDVRRYFATFRIVIQKLIHARIETLRVRVTLSMKAIGACLSLTEIVLLREVELESQQPACTQRSTH